MNRDVLLFFLVLAVCGIIGGFVGAEWSDHERVFSPTGALLAAVGIAAVLLGLGALFDRKERKRRQKVLPDSIRGVLDRMTSRSPTSQTPVPRPQHSVQTAVDASLRRKMAAVDQEKVDIFVETMLRFRSMTDPVKTADLARTKLLMQHDPIIAAVKSQKEFLDVLLNSSRGNPSVMGTHIANSCLGLCELVIEEKVNTTAGRDYFDSYKKVFERVHGIKMPFEGGPFDFDTSLEIAREVLNRKRP